MTELWMNKRWNGLNVCLYLCNKTDMYLDFGVVMGINQCRKCLLYNVGMEQIGFGSDLYSLMIRFFDV